MLVDFSSNQKKRSGRIENTKKRTFKVYFKFDFSGIIFIFFQIMRVNAKVTFGTFHRESFGILQKRQPGFRQNAFLSDKRGRPNKMFDKNVLTVQEGTMQFVQMFDSLECYITNIHIFTLPVLQKLAQICPLYIGAFLLILTKLFL